MAASRKSKKILDLAELAPSSVLLVAAVGAGAAGQGPTIDPTGSPR